MRVLVVNADADRGTAGRSLLLAALPLLAAATFAGPAAAQRTGLPLSRSACDPSFGGRYRILQTRVRAPDDKSHYGPCRDFGKWSGETYRGKATLPQGYWTYASPYWYIWQEQTNVQACDPSMHGRYVGFEMRLFAPDDRSHYGACVDFGKATLRNYRLSLGLPTGGFWTYAAPYWYYWKQRTR